jgi:hypothetical protein
MPKQPSGPTIDRAKYTELRDEDGATMEAVYRLQEAKASKTCAFERCRFPRNEILPLMRYARVYYPDEDAVEMFHYSCFQRVFGNDRRD